MALRLRPFIRLRNILLPETSRENSFHKQNFLSFTTSSSGQTISSRPYFKAAVVIGTLGIGGGLYGYLSTPDTKLRKENYTLTEKSTIINPNIPDIKPSREVVGPATDLGLDLTLYQYQTCPFCCKVRAFLEFYGIPYKVVEVNPVMRKQLKFSEYKKVPILIAQERGSQVKHQLNDSSVIISMLGTYLLYASDGMEKVFQYYMPYTYKNEDGKEVTEVMNKYFLMYGDKVPKGKSDDFLKKERQWRKWADNELVHILSPNIYRTYDEALQAFNYFSEVGEWEKNFSTLERLIVIYVGATAMYFVGKRLKKKHSLKEDVRVSLYDACKLWVKEIGSKKKFMGGDQPNLADLAVYGLLSSIEGCLAFKDLLVSTNIGPWYYRTKEAVVNHSGFQMIS